MCDLSPGKLLSPKTHFDFNNEVAGFKPGRFNPIPGPRGHGAVFGQFSGTYQGNDVMHKTGISPAAEPAPSFADLYAKAYAGYGGPTTPAAQVNPLAAGGGLGEVASGAASLGPYFAPGSSNVKVTR
ncbi:MAG: hypothetical protein HYU59_05750 [Magnetospirillum gryphiswaldense]|nr:hypothetical protein [Magnetospirillum gryphiswaldense]